MSRRLLTLAGAAGATILATAAYADTVSIQAASDHINVPALAMFCVFVLMTLGHHLLGGEADQVGSAVLLRGRRHHRRPERPRHRRRLHVGGLVPRHFRPRLHVRL